MPVFRHHAPAHEGMGAAAQVCAGSIGAAAGACAGLGAEPRLPAGSDSLPKECEGCRAHLLSPHAVACAGSGGVTAPLHAGQCLMHLIALSTELHAHHSLPLLHASAGHRRGYGSIYILRMALAQHSCETAATSQHVEHHNGSQVSVHSGVLTGSLTVPCTCRHYPLSCGRTVQDDVIFTDEDCTVPLLMAPWAASLAASLTLGGGSANGGASSPGGAEGAVRVSRIALLSSSLHRRAVWCLGQGQPPT